MDEYAEIYFLDEDDYDYRNAPRDHRTGGGGGGGARPARGMTRPRTFQASSGRGGMTRPGVGRQPVALVRQQQPGGFAFGSLTGGEMIELAAKVLASLQPLPSAPVATGKPEDDVANLITYQGALAQHAKRDEQLRTLGDLIGKVLS